MEMNLFDKIPENFFSLFVSKNKKVYMDALFVLGEAFEQEMAILKENVVARLISNLEQQLNQEDFSEEDEEEELKDNNVSSKAYFLLRKLKASGWIELEMQRDSFEEYIILPDYAIKFIHVFKSIVQENQVEYNSYVFATYSSLKLASIEKNETYQAIMTAYTNTMQLINELKSLYNSLGMFHRKMCQQDNIHEIMEGHFLEYKEYSDEIIFPRFTRDSVPRYKAPIREMLQNILADEERWENTVNIASRNKKYQSREEAEQDLLDKIRTIMDLYENIDLTMNQIEEKNMDYVRASVQRIHYLLTNDKELKGKLVKILKHANQDAVLENMGQEANLFRQEIISKDSIYIRNSNDKRKQGEPMPLKQDVELDSKAWQELAKSLENAYSQEKIKNFMETNFKDKPFIYSAEIKLDTVEDLILLILATLKADKSGKAFYTIEDSEEVIDNHGFKIPNIKFVRRK